MTHGQELSGGREWGLGGRGGGVFNAEGGLRGGLG